jgi:dTDP-4-dehydrorhamnose 3,5-epimerase
MIFTDTGLPGAWLIDPEKLEDERGFFARTFCREEFSAHGLNPKISQCSLSYNRSQGTLRGMHYQAPPHEEEKLVTCVRGAAYDVIIDLRADSPTFCRWFGVELEADSYRMLYVPRGFVHGFQTLKDHTSIFYQISEFYHPECARGIRWDDPAFGITWPSPPAVISDKDRSIPDYHGESNG